MNFGGFVRTLQGSFTTLLATLIIIGILTGLAILLTSQLSDEDEVKQWRSWILLGTKLSCIVSILIFLVNAMFLGFTDRMPRSDVNKQPVYDQMESH
jgi:uncharacterized membrane protein